METQTASNVRLQGLARREDKSSLRYTKYVKLVQLINAEVLAEIYQRFYPLFQQAYVELGYPQGYFNDRLIAAIDDLLAAPELADPLKLVSIKILYEYADPNLQRRSAGQKINCGFYWRRYY